ncbi:PREDICTED: spermatogenesis-associated protein 24 [Gekko japonicus]|uniref:Spermatogenesis-associated protein 24 n=1 Tax=Gekko japonicus TaxID=146911 RepID=A0ABM1JYG9_GEKJA|nr:PREDICTED: spermatogenesis-associated protein 24 [Gekko japonicus]
MASFVVFRQLRDVIATQEVLVEKLRRQITELEKNSISRVEYEAIVKKLEKEEAEHAKTKNYLAKESEQLEFALGEIEILSKQLEREKQAFDNALSNVKNKVLKESIQKDKLKSKCTEIESHIRKQEDILNSKDNEIKELQHFVTKQKQTLKKQVTDFKIQKQQEYYMAKVLGGKTKKSVK